MNNYWRQITEPIITFYYCNNIVVVVVYLAT